AAVGRDREVHRHDRSSWRTDTNALYKPAVHGPSCHLAPAGVEDEDTAVGDTDASTAPDALEPTGRLLAEGAATACARDAAPRRARQHVDRVACGHHIDDLVHLTITERPQDAWLTDQCGINRQQAAGRRRR